MKKIILFLLQLVWCSTGLFAQNTYKREDVLAVRFDYSYGEEGAHPYIRLPKGWAKIPSRLTGIISARIPNASGQAFALC